jgi:hypothetical protein
VSDCNVSFLDRIPFRSKRPAPQCPPLDDAWAAGLPWSAEEILTALEWRWNTDTGADLEARAARLRATRRRGPAHDAPSGKTV